MMKKVILVLSLLCCGFVQADGAVHNSKVQIVRIDGNGKGIVYFETSMTGERPGCVHANYVNTLGFDTNTPAGASIFMLVTTAKALNQRITAHGTGNCSIYPSFLETWNWGYMRD